MPTLHVVAGPNGAGKTLLYEYLIKPRHPALTFINPQAHALEFLQGVADARERATAARLWADHERDRLLREGRPFVTETVFSHPSRVALILQARALGYEVVLYALGLDDPRKLLTRVAQQAREGGEAVPSHKVLERYPRTVDNLRRGVRVADLSFLFDSADIHNGGPRLVASVVGGEMRLHTLLRPRWVEKVLGSVGG